MSGCGSLGDNPFFASLLPAEKRSGRTLNRPNYAEVYGKYSGEPHPVNAFAYSGIDPTFLRQQVEYRGSEAPGTIVVATSERLLYFVEPGQRATRYGVGVGREGFGWSGAAQINMHRSWPEWIPPKEMVARDPNVKAQLVATSRGQGVPGGSLNPLGARAMYLYTSEGDTGYRIHGTLEPETIGTNVSSGCVRLVNQDMIHLYGRAPDGTKVIVLPV
jgi:lipoprotein-anchoring transpeptidase ErfK/SrfK